MQSILELFKLEVHHSSTSFWQKCKIAQESLIQQLNQHWDYLRQKSIIHQFCFSKSARLHRSCTYTATQSILGLFKLEVNYSSTLFQQKYRIAQELHLYSNCSQPWDYLSQKSIILQLCFSKSARLHRSHLFSNSVNTRTI